LQALDGCFVLFLDEKNQKSRAAEKKAKNFPVWLK
jgi:hypothetical protein